MASRGRGIDPDGADLRCWPARQPDCPQCVIRALCNFKDKTVA